MLEELQQDSDFELIDTPVKKIKSILFTKNQLPKKSARLIQFLPNPRLEEKDSSQKKKDRNLSKEFCKSITEVSDDIEDEDDMLKSEIEFSECDFNQLVIQQRLKALENAVCTQEHPQIQQVQFQAYQKTFTQEY